MHQGSRETELQGTDEQEALLLWRRQVSRLCELHWKSCLGAAAACCEEQELGSTVIADCLGIVLELGLLSAAEVVKGAVELW